MPDQHKSPDALSEEFYQDRLSELPERVSEKRLKHILGVSSTAEALAKEYGADAAKARLAGLLHDWDKGLDDDGIRARAKELGIVEEVGPWVVENMPQVLHGPTAAVALSREHPSIPSDVIQSIYRHTTAAPDMTDLDKIIYIADAIEPGRSFDRLEHLQSDVGKLSLDDLFFEVYKFWTMALIEHNVVLHPDTMSIWNTYASKRKKHKKKQGKKAKGHRR